jgi:hypothetical protein
VCSELGFPIAEDKTVEPTTDLVSLGVRSNTLNMTMLLLPEKLDTLHEAIQAVQQAKKITHKQLQFIRRIINPTVGVRKPHHKIRVTINMKHDLLVWI